MKSYCIYSPEFDVCSGGIRVMYGLYGWLIAKGQIAYINKYPAKDYVAIYPEIVHGNPMNAPKVVRYILNKPGFMPSFGVTGPKEFDKDDLLIAFSRVFMDVIDDHLMFLPILNLHIFKDYGRKRTKRCVFYGKGADTHPNPVPKEFKGEVIYLNRVLCQDQQELADKLNECDVVYIYDQVTAMTEIARLCGCRVVLIPTIGITEVEYRKYEPGLNGFSYGEDLEVPLDVDGFRSHYISLRQIFSRKLDHFIDITQQL